MLMKNWPVLKIFFVLYLTICVVYTVSNWETLSYAEGWGVVYMIGLIFFGLIGLLINYILAKAIKNTKRLNLAGIIISILFMFFLLIELKIFK